MIKILRTTSYDKDFQALISLLDAELNERYGIVQKQNDVYNQVEFIDTVALGYIGDVPVACGCFKIFNGNAVEIKRMFVKTEMRGSGIAKDVLLELEKWAIDMNFSEALLETGVKQPEAIRFYSKLGYSRIENYGPYIGNTNSVCMSKTIK